MEATEVARNPEILVYFVRHNSRMGLAGAVRRATETGFACAPRDIELRCLARNKPKASGFGSLIEDATRRVEAARNISAVE
jgi:hypothetical protein